MLEVLGSTSFVWLIFAAGVTLKFAYLSHMFGRAARELRARGGHFLAHVERLRSYTDSDDATARWVVPELTVRTASGDVRQVTVDQVVPPKQISVGSDVTVLMLENPNRAMLADLRSGDETRAMWCRMAAIVSFGGLVLLGAAQVLAS